MMKQYVEAIPERKKSDNYYANTYITKLLIYEFLLYNYKIRLLTDAPLLLDHLERYYLKSLRRTSEKLRTITILFLLNRQKAEIIRQEIIAAGGFSRRGENYECTFSSDITTFLIFVEAPLDSISHYVIFNNTFKTWLKINNFAFLHASCFTNHKNSFIVTGPSGVGKTTLLISAVVNGFKIVSDDSVMVYEKKKRTISFAFPYILGLSERNNDKSVLDLLDANIWAQCCTPKMLMFLEKSTGGCLQWELLSKQDALIMLLTATSKPFFLGWESEQAKRNVFNRLYELVSQTKSGILKIGYEHIKKEFLNRGYLWRQIEKII